MSVVVFFASHFIESVAQFDASGIGRELFIQFVGEGEFFCPEKDVPLTETEKQHVAVVKLVADAGTVAKRRKYAVGPGFLVVQAFFECVGPGFFVLPVKQIFCQTGGA